jgi:hypothetical protein
MVALGAALGSELFRFVCFRHSSEFYRMIGAAGQRHAGNLSVALALSHVRHTGERQCTKRRDIPSNQRSKLVPAISIDPFWSSYV